MSLVTGVIVYISGLTVDDDASQEEVALHAYLTGPVRPDGTGDGAQHLRRLDGDQAGGYKWLGGSIYAAGFNYVNTEQVIAFLEVAPWAGAEPVAIIDYEHDHKPRVWRP